MKKIFVCIRLFTLSQTIYLYDENNQIVSVSQCPLNDLSTYLVDYANQKDADEITLTGGKTYCLKIKKTIEEYNLTKYNKKIIVKIEGEEE